jgi:hypothetical protein
MKELRVSGIRDLDIHRSAWFPSCGCFSQSWGCDICDGWVVDASNVPLDAGCRVSSNEGKRYTSWSDTHVGSPGLCTWYIVLGLQSTRVIGSTRFEGRTEHPGSLSVLACICVLPTVDVRNWSQGSSNSLSRRCSCWGTGNSLSLDNWSR